MRTITRIGWFIALALLQGLVLNYVHIGEYATPTLYIYFILKMDSDVKISTALLWAFFLGLVVDMLSNTPGLNAAALLWTALWRKNLLHLYSESKDPYDIYEPSIKSLGWGAFFLYISTAVLLHAFILHSIDYFTFYRIDEILLKTLFTSISTIFCVLCLDTIRKSSIK